MDNFYDPEFIGIKDEGSSYELEQVQNFSDFISFQDEHHYVHLPWNKDLAKQIPSNLKVLLAVAESVYENLEKQNIANAYEEVFEQQEALGIIEPVNKKMPDQIWIHIDLSSGMNLTLQPRLGHSSTAVLRWVKLHL